MRASLLSIFILPLFIFGMSLESFAQKPSRTPPIEKNREKRFSIKQLFQSPRLRQKRKANLSQKSSDYSGRNISKNVGPNQSKKSKAIGTNQILTRQKRGVGQTKESRNYSGGKYGKKKGLSNFKLGGARKLSLQLVSPQVRKRRSMSSQSLSFSGENIALPSQGYLLNKDRRMNRKAEKGSMSANLTKHKKRKSTMSFSSLKFNGPYAGKRTTTRVKLRKRPVADKMAGKKRFRLRRMSRRAKSNLKYDKKEREIWAR